MEQSNSIKNDNHKAKILLITANVGTIFESLDVLLEPWLDEFTKKLSRLKPQFVALHMQEIGGKNYKTSMQSIDPFFKKFLSNNIIQQYDRYLIAIDSDFTDENNFTSLCNVYLIHESLKEDEVQLFNFSDKTFFNYTSRQIFSGNLNNNHIIYKERYMKNYFPDFQWSRKGFLQTRWRLKKHNFDLVNIHLFHDPSNLIAMTSTPSIYSENRKKALEYSIQKIKNNSVNEGNDQYMFSIFGDFNFRLDLASLINDFANKTNSIEFKDNNNKLLKIICKASNDKEIFTIEEKKFKWHHDSTIQCVKNELLKYDIELSMFEEPLFEVERNFPPSYPFMEELENPDKYMDSRCPAWCDRILMNSNFMKYIERDSEKIEYGMIGENVCMGDHKPIFLYFVLHDQKAHSTEKHSNNIINNINTLTYPLNYVYLNNKLINLQDNTVDLHDNALFNNVSLVKHHSQFSKFAHYVIDNLNTSSTKTSDTKIKLNPWLKSILEYISIFNKSTSCEECLFNKLNETSCKKFKGCGSDKSFFFNFFLNTLNGNFFKLKHLYSFLDESIKILEEKVGKNDRKNKEFVEEIDSTIPFEYSANSLFLLNEIYKFLTLSCTYNYLKLLLNRNNTFKKYLLFNQTSTPSTNINNNNNKSKIKNVDFKIDNQYVKCDGRITNTLNNNNENCINLNEAK